MDVIHEFSTEKILSRKQIFTNSEYTKLYREFHAKITSNIPLFLYSISTLEKAEIAHDVTTKILLNIHRIDFGNNVNGYIYAITKYYCIDRKRAAKKQFFSSINVNSFIDENTPLNLLNNKEDKAYISALISQLPVLKQALITDKYLNEIPTKIIAEKYSLSQKQVQNQLYNSLKQLKKLIKG